MVQEEKQDRSDRKEIKVHLVLPVYAAKMVFRAKMVNQSLAFRASGAALEIAVTMASTVKMDLPL